MKKKLLVTGASGFVAGSVVAHGIKDWRVCAVGRKKAPPKSMSQQYYCVDICDYDSLKKLFEEIKPTAVIHTAAIADIDFCQNNHKLAEEVNVGGTRNLALLCENFASRMILCSTDTVFNGSKGNNVEEDLPIPVNFYAETKISAEKIVSEIVPDSVVARLSLVIGLPVSGAGNSFLEKMRKSLKKGESIRFPINEIRSPIDIITLGLALVELAGNEFCGLIHLAGNDQLTRFDMGKIIAGQLGCSSQLIVPVDSNSIAGRAPRPNNVSLNNAKAKKILATQMRSLVDGLELYLNFQKS